MKIGRSLSFCVRDIARGLVAIDDVVVIVTGTQYRNNVEFMTLLAQYKKAYWGKDDPEKCAQIAVQLNRLGKIHQPRLIDSYVMPKLPATEFWFDLAPGASSDPVVVEAYENYAVLLKLHS
jgi:hypothetical protein